MLRLDKQLVKQGGKCSLSLLSSAELSMCSESVVSHDAELSCLSSTAELSMCSVSCRSFTGFVAELSMCSVSVVLLQVSSSYVLAGPAGRFFPPVVALAGRSFCGVVSCC